MFRVPRLRYVLTQINALPKMSQGYCALAPACLRDFAQLMNK